MGLQSNSSQIAATCDQAKFNFVGHDFHDIPQDLRFTISELAQWEVLGVPSELNHVRYEAEGKEGLHHKKGGKRKAKGGKK